MDLYESRRHLFPVLVFPIMTMFACLEGTQESETSDDALNATMHRSYLPIVYGINGGSGFYATSMRIQNPGTLTADVQVSLYGTGANPVTVLRGPITSGASVTLSPPGSSLPSGWSSMPTISLQTFGGSAVVEAIQPVATAVNLVRNCGQPCALGSYSAIEAGASQLVVPLVQKNTSGVTSWLAIQNASDQEASASIDFRPREAGMPFTAPTIFMRPRTTVQLRLDDVLPVGSIFSGSAIVSSLPDFFGNRPPLAVIANVEKTDGPANMHSLQSTSGLNPAVASSQVALPLVMANNADFFTGLVIVNTGPAPTTIRVDYSPNQAAGAAMPCATPPPKNVVNVAPGAAVSYSTTGNEPGFLGCRYVGSARASSTGAPIIAQVSEAATGASAASAYEGVNVTDARDTVVLPIVMANNGPTNGEFYTGVQIQNVASQPAHVTLKYEPNTVTGPNTCAQPPAVMQTIQAGASMNTLQAGAGFFATCRYVGSATVTGQNFDGSHAQLVVLVNQARLTPDSHQDALTTYIGRPNS
jgi:hypothetical protein